MFEALVLSWFLTAGYCPLMSDQVGSSNIEIDYSRPTTFLDIGARAKWRGFALYGDVKTFEYMSPPYATPYRANYSIGLSYTRGPVTFAVDHECDHPVVYYDNFKSEYKYLSNYTQFSVTIRGSNK